MKDKVILLPKSRQTVYVDVFDINTTYLLICILFVLQMGKPGSQTLSDMHISHNHCIQNLMMNPKLDN